ncbi:MAG: glycosyltransferase family 4 protein [Xanthobacteraceae bacterium]|nr:glycosyltransferase family 4 protein [Xanthobacteraceae bacterium]MBV9628393.1 glycosyltransferase family 4 protein [Xanthobacteraceae bacterium]
MTTPHVVIINDDCVASGGAAGIALTSARVLQARGVRVSYLAGDARSGSLPQPESVLSLSGRHIMEGARGAAALRGLYDHNTRRSLEQWIAENDSPQAIYHLHNWHKVLSPSVFAALKPVQDRLFISTHDYFLVCPNGGQFNYPRHHACDLKPMSSECVFTQCDRRNYIHKLWRVARTAMQNRVLEPAQMEATILAVHDGMVPYLVGGGIPRHRIHVLRNPITPWSRERVTAERNKEILFVGRLERDKGIDLLAAAARDAGAILTVVGDGPLRKELALQYPDVNFLGFRPPHEIATIARNARILVSPSRWRETFGLTTLEALTSGIPVVVSRFALIAGEVAEHGFGRTCNPYDEDELATTLKTLLHDSETVAAMSRRAFMAAAHLATTPEQWGNELLALYTGRLATRRDRTPRHPFPSEPRRMAPC